MRAWSALSVLAIVVPRLLAAADAPRDAAAKAPSTAATRPIAISGIYPHLAAISNGRSECGIGAVVPWLDRLWFITYPAHGGDGRLWEVDRDLRLSVRGTAGGTHACRMIHRESNQLIIGPYFIDAKGNIRVCKAGGRLTAAMRHLTDPANKVYYFAMEGEFYEVDVRTLAVTKLFTKPVPGAHGKGGYTSQGRVVIANNGGGGVLAEWDGKEWRIIERKQFCEVTGPGGIEGASDDKQPIWATGWDERSVIFKILQDGTWHTFRLPKGSYAYDAAHGWFTEWPRIRQIAPETIDIPEVVPPRFMMDMHGLYYGFRADLRPDGTWDLHPASTHLRMTPDFCRWEDKLVLASNDNSVMQNPLGGQPQSNLVIRQAGEQSMGRPSGFGGPWVRDAVKAHVPSDAFFTNDFAKRVVHLAHESNEPVEFTLEAEANGDGKWRVHKTLKVPPRGYAWYVLPLPHEAWIRWMRLKADRDCTATAYFHFTNSGPRRDQVDLPHQSSRSGLLLPTTTGGKLRFLRSDGSAIEFDERLRRVQVEADPTERERGKIKRDVEEDDASMIVQGHRFPRADAAFVGGDARGLREVVTERNLLNCGGTFYEVPRGRIGGARPVCTHGRKISDFCSWRGLFVAAGLSGDLGDLWMGAVDDLWRWGKPRGVGGPWRRTTVKADAPSDPYIMTGFDRKRLDLSHDAPGDVTFRIEVDFLASPEPSWHEYARLKVSAGQTLTHAFPDGYSAHWVRLVADRGCSATATFTYD